MNKNIIDWTITAIQKYDIKPKRMLDIGSLNVNGTVKHLFPESEYVGIDFRKGKDVDIVINAHDLMQIFDRNTFDAIICMNMLEHDDNPMRTLSVIGKLIKRGGFLFFAIPTIDFPIHDHPDDYWRLTEQGVKKIVFKEGLWNMTDMDTIHTKTDRSGNKINKVVCALGQKI